MSVPSPFDKNPSSRDIHWHAQPSPSPKPLTNVTSTQPPSQFNNPWPPTPLLYGNQQPEKSVTSQSFVEFHNSEFPDGTTITSTPEVSLQKQQPYSFPLDEQSTSAAGGGSMPVHLPWPTHPHVLTYAATASTSSVHICSCRNCRAEHYNTAVYSCDESGCTFHICLQCALHQLAAQHQLQQQKAQRRRKSGGGQDTAIEMVESKYDTSNNDVHRNSFSDTVVNDGFIDRLNSTVMDTDAPYLDVSMVMPCLYTEARLQKEYVSTKLWIRSVAYDAEIFQMRLVLNCSLHPHHSLLYYPLAPNTYAPDDAAPRGNPGTVAPTKRRASFSGHSLSASTDRFFCDALLSPYCISHELNKCTRPIYYCPQCNYRLCLPCFRWYLIDVFAKLRATLSYEESNAQISALMKCYYRSRQVDNTAIAYSDLVTRKELTWEKHKKYAEYIAVFAVFMSVILINAMLTWVNTDNTGSEGLLDTVLIFIFCFIAALATHYLTGAVQHNHRKGAVHCKIIDSIYHDPSLVYFFSQPKPQPIVVSAITPRQRDKLSDNYHHQALISQQQNATVYLAYLSIIGLGTSLALLIAGMVVLFSQVICVMPNTFATLDYCTLKTTLPISVGLFFTLIYPLSLRVLLLGWNAFDRLAINSGMHAREARFMVKSRKASKL